MTIGATNVNYESAGQDQVPLSGDSNTKLVFIDTGDSLLDRTEVVYSVKRPRANPSSPGGYTQARTHVLLKRPYVDATTGERTIGTAKFEINTDVRETEANLQFMVAAISHITSQMAAAGSLEDFATQQSLD